ncbi:MAG: excinuclease ABC subunit UvrA [Opitutales bacterium]|nr:excinuclease ABC subunit UvrA [Opitutales bacterium]MCH8539275.1 excinuclease ABC subunit UvrA [Opitutales bacterium]
MAVPKDHARCRVANQADGISIHGAREHNLQNVSVFIPRNSLTVLTGVSGSGKSSLAFDTLYAEGHRKYMESLSARARQLLAQLPRPDIDFIHGLSPVVAIEQKGSGGNARSTVGTVTEIADYARLLWTLRGEAFCPVDGGRIVRQTIDQQVDRLLSLPEKTKVVLVAPYLSAKRSVLRDEVPHLRQKGYQRIRLDGEIISLDEKQPIRPGRGNALLELVIDRLVVRPDQRSRMADSLELAFAEGEDRVTAIIQRPGSSEEEEIALRQNLACEICGEVYPPLEPRLFSWNHRDGACPTCGGTGRKMTFAEDLVVPDPAKSVRNGALKPLRIGGKQLIIRHNSLLKQLAEQVPFDINCPWQDLPSPVRHFLLHGDQKRLFHLKLKRGRKNPPQEQLFPGVLALLDKAAAETKSEGYRARLMTYQRGETCPDCQGGRLAPYPAAVRVEGKTLPDFYDMPLQEAHDWMEGLATKLRGTDRHLDEILHSLEQRLRFLCENGLGYLSLFREYNSLSGGEGQRVRLATQLGMGLVGVTYVLDEPTVGLHPIDNQRLIQSLELLRDLGNTVVVVEHDEETMRASDYLVEMGPGAGSQGGRVLFQGPPKGLEAQPNSPTGQYLSGRAKLEKNVPTLPPGDRKVLVTGASGRNLQKVDADFPVGLLTCVVGVSGSGKSTLVNDTLAKVAAMKLHRAKDIPAPLKDIKGLENFDSVVRVDQTPIGRTPRSNPATFTKVFDPLRALFAACPLSKVRGYKPSRFSFNVKGGRCEKCQGDGIIKVDLQFMADAYGTCPACQGKRYNRETLEVRFKGHSIADVLDLTVSDARELFAKIPRIEEKLATMEAVGLGYLRLGQSATTLSGGEAQRLKLSLELSKRQQGRTLYLLDEPTSGLHWEDVQKLLDVLFRLREAGNTIIVIEHHPDFIRLADWIIELGPGGGREGGQIIFAGPYEHLLESPHTPTAKVLSSEKGLRSG